MNLISVLVFVLSALALLSGRKTESEQLPEKCCDEETKSEVIEVQDVPKYTSSNSKSKSTRTIPPFIASHDIPRGAIHALQTLLGYILMLSVMCVHLLWDL